MMDSIKSSLRPLSIAAAVGFIAFFVWIVMIADKGEGTPWWSVIIDPIPFGDKVGHFCLVGTLCFLCNLAFPAGKPGFLPRFVTLATFLLFCMLSLEELSQAFIKSRHLDLFDWLADLTGLAVGQFSAMKARRFLRSPATTAP